MPLAIQQLPSDQPVIAQETEHPALETLARYTSVSREAFTGATEGGPKPAAARRRALGAMPPEIVASAANAYRGTMIY